MGADGTGSQVLSGGGGTTPELCLQGSVCTNQRLAAAGLSEARLSGLEWPLLLIQQPQAARAGARTRLTLPPTPPVERLSTSCWHQASGHSSFRPQLAWVSATVSFGSMSRSPMAPRCGVQRGDQREGCYHGDGSSWGQWQWRVAMVSSGQEVSLWVGVRSAQPAPRTYLRAGPARSRPPQRGARSPLCPPHSGGLHLTSGGSAPGAAWAPAPRPGRDHRLGWVPRDLRSLGSPSLQAWQGARRS